MDRLNVVVILLFFVYFMSFLTGVPSVHIGLTPDEAEELRQLDDTNMLLLEGGGEGTAEAREAARQAFEEGLREQSPVQIAEGDATTLLPEENPDDPMALRRAELEAAKSRVVFKRKPGLVERVLVERRMLAVFDDPLLESDSRPEDLLRQIARSFTTEAVQTGVNAFWCAQILLCLVAFWKRHWFYGPMSTIVMLISVLMLSFDLITAQRSAMALYENQTGQLLEAAVGALLIVLGSGFLLQKILPPHGRLFLTETNFMGHMRRLPLPAGAPRRARFLKPTFEIGAIMLVGLIVANLLLFPIYKLQLSFPGFFAGLLSVGMLVLAYFYVQAYSKVARSQQSPGDTGAVSRFSAIAFLGFRMLSNTFYIIAVVSLVCVIFGLAIVLTAYNIVFLQGFELLPIADSL
ncbi:MAG: hypothetical protein NXI24_23940 [bacterium]|nr:hypothetical protein [bacterium]